MGRHFSPVLGIAGLLLIIHGFLAASLNPSPIWVERAETHSPAFNPDFGVIILGSDKNALNRGSLENLPIVRGNNPQYGRDPVSARKLAKQIISRRGMPLSQWTCLRELWQRESGWRWKADNPTSSAYGIAQVLKTPKHYTPRKQIRKGLEYISKRYGSPCRALQHHNNNNWY